MGSWNSLLQRQSLREGGKQEGSYLGVVEGGTSLAYNRGNRHEFLNSTPCCKEGKKRCNEKNSSKKEGGHPRRRREEKKI